MIFTFQALSWQLEGSLTGRVGSFLDMAKGDDRHGVHCTLIVCQGDEAAGTASSESVLV